jgi:hypothetical protein
VLIAAMFAVIAFDMGGQVGIRNIIMPLSVMLLAIVQRVKIPWRFLPQFGVFVVYPTFLLLVGVAKGADLSVAISQYQSTLLAFILLIILSNSPYEFLAKALYVSIGITAFIAILIAVVLTTGADFFSGLLSRLHEESAGYFGFRAVGGNLLPNVYFKSTLFYVPAAFFFLFRRQYFLYSICLIGLVVAVSKTGMFIVLVGTILIVLKNERIFVKLLIVAIAFAVFIYIYQSPISYLFVEILEGRSDTISMREGHFTSIKHLFSDQPFEFLFGFGLGSEFYSEGAGAYVTNIELDHLNCIRKYGLIWSCIFFGMVLYTALRAIQSPFKDVRILGICLVVAFVVAGTNPVLISPVFFLIFIITILARRQASVKKNEMPAGAIL